MESNDQGQEAQDSQQEPQEDSGLQTPQPDQPVPTPEDPQPEPEPTVIPEDTPENAATSATYVTPPVEAPRTNEEMQEQADARERAREDQVRQHNERSGGGDVQEGELSEQRQEHNDRVSGEALDPPVTDQEAS